MYFDQHFSQLDERLRTRKKRIIGVTIKVLMKISLSNYNFGVVFNFFRSYHYGPKIWRTRWLYLEASMPLTRKAKVK